MSQDVRETLSALMDNEGDELELRRLLKILDDTPDTADSWRRYHLIRSMLSRDQDVDIGVDLSAGIMARIQNEPKPVLEVTNDGVNAKTASPRRGFAFASSAAIAAAVSLMVITGVQFYNGSGNTGSDGTGSGNTGSGDMTQPGFASSEPSGIVSPESASGIMPASTSSGSRSRTPSLVDLPLFQTPTASLGRSQSGLMNISADAPMFMAPQMHQSQVINDQGQAQLLQTYLDRHAQGAAYRSGDTWTSLLRASGDESLGLH